MTQKERITKYYNHEKYTGFINYFSGRDLNLQFIITGLDEHPPLNGAGKDWFGCEWVMGEDGTPVPDCLATPILKDIKEWREKVVFPDIKSIDWAKSAKMDQVSAHDPDKFTYCTIFQGPFERLHTLMSFEDALCAFISNPKEVAAFFDRIMEMKLDIIDALAKHYHPDVICFHDDWGTQNNMFFSPNVWEALLRPQIQKAVDRCHEYGIFFEMHSCGKMDQIIPSFADMGIDCFQCMGINDIPAAMKKTKGRLSFMVSPHYQELEAACISGTLTEDQVRKAIREEVMEDADAGAYSPILIPLNNWWYEIAVDEIGRCEKEVMRRGGICVE